MKYRITHITKYKYHGKVNLCYNEARLTPRNLPGQTCNSSIISVDPAPTLISEREDFFENFIQHFSIENAHEELTVTAVSQVERIPVNYQFDLAQTLTWKSVREQMRNYDVQYAQERQFILDSPLLTPSEEIMAYALNFFLVGRPIFDATMNLMSRIHQDFEFLQGVTDVSTSLAQLMKERKGVCQDFAHIGIACICSMELPARYVSDI